MILTISTKDGKKHVPLQNVEVSKPEPAMGVATLVIKEASETRRVNSIPKE